MTMALEGATAKQLARVAIEWGGYAGEDIATEEIGGFIYAYGSELGMRRLAHKFRSFNVKYSENRGTWYFCNERRAGEERPK